MLDALVQEGYVTPPKGIINKDFKYLNEGRALISAHNKRSCSIPPTTWNEAATLERMGKKHLLALVAAGDISPRSLIPKRHPDDCFVYSMVNALGSVLEDSDLDVVEIADEFERFIARVLRKKDSMGPKRDPLIVGIRLHLNWATHDERLLLDGNVGNDCKSVIQRYADDHGWLVHCTSVLSNQVQLLITVPTNVSAADAVHQLQKAIHSDLTKRHKSTPKLLWAPSFYSAAAGFPPVFLKSERESLSQLEPRVFRIAPPLVALSEYYSD